MPVIKKGKNDSETGKKYYNDDYNYIIKAVQYLQNNHGVSFFITSRDFDIIYRWWEKRIPADIIKNSISKVVERWKSKKKKIYGFSNFSYEVKKNFKVFLEMGIGEEVEEKRIDDQKTVKNFLKNFPEELMELKPDFKEIIQKHKKGEITKPDSLYEKLLNLFEKDRELNLKTEIFIKGVSPELRKPDLKKRYKLNYLMNKFNIPDFDYLSSR